MSQFKEQLAYQIARTASAGYVHLALPIIKRKYHPGDPETGANEVHEFAMRLSALADESSLAQALIRQFYKLVYEPLEGEYHVGGVTLPSDLILAAGWVKGVGFETQQQANEALSFGENLIPGFFSFVQASGGLAEFGSYTAYPTPGNEHPNMWRHEPGSAQNRVGLTNPGSWAAAEFMSLHKDLMPKVFGINIASTACHIDNTQAAVDIKKPFRDFLEKGIRPTWFSLNISCPHTSLDPRTNQTEENVRQLCRSALEVITSYDQNIPLWVKLGPDLSDSQYQRIFNICAEEGVRAIIAVNTRGEPAPHDPSLVAGISGRDLHADGVRVTQVLLQAKHDRQARGLSADVDIIGCGGVEDGASYLDYGDEVAARQWLTALLFRGPTAAALIRSEASRLNAKQN